MNIILPDGSVKELAEGATIADVAASIGAGLAKAALAGKIDGAPADLNAPVYDGATVEIITSKSAEALGIMRHSCAHVMAEAVQELFPGAQIAFGPATEDGFFYDFELSRSLTPDDFAAIEEKMAAIVKADEPFVREVVSRDQAKEIFADQRFKLEHIDELPADEEISIYRHGSFVDLCSGPHLPSAGKIGAFKVMKLAGAYWKGDAEREQLQRVYGTAFFKQKELDEHLHNLAEAEKRDHRKLGRELGIYMMDEDAGVGLPLYLPRGARVIRLLQEWLRRDLYERGYEEVITDQLYLVTQFCGQLLPAFPVFLIQCIFYRNDGVFLHQFLPMCDQFFGGKYGACLRQLVLAHLAGLPLAGSSIHSDLEILAGLITGFLYSL